MGCSGGANSHGGGDSRAGDNTEGTSSTGVVVGSGVGSAGKGGGKDAVSNASTGAGWTSGKD